MKIKILFLILASFFIRFGALAQCSMCRASVENNVSNGETSIGAGLNSGILYLVVMPYLMAGIIGYLWYRASKKKKAKLQSH
jgi:preprotein translocase subunit SecY